MRTVRLVLVAALFGPAAGCKWIEDVRQNQGRPRPTGAIEPVQAEQLVRYVNDRSRALTSLSYDNTRMRCYQNGMPLPAVLDGDLVCAQPRNFRMKSSARMASATIDLGSNDEQFWVFAQVPGDKPVYVYASHQDFAAGKAPLPGGIPFEPDWVMQALGMTELPVTNQYRVTPNDKDRTYTLSWPVTTPSRQQLTKEIVFDADTATGTRPQVKRHVVKDVQGKVVCTAEIKSARPVPSAGGGPVVQYPTHVALRWEAEKFEMDLTLGTAQVNQPPSAEQAQRIFTRPRIPNAPGIDLAQHSEFSK